MDEREQEIRDAIHMMMEDGANLTAEKVPELPELRKLSGRDDVTSEERDAWAIEWQEANAPKSAKKGKGGKSAKKPQPVEDVTGPQHLPTNLFHEERPTRTVRDLDEWRDARDEGYRDLSEFPPDVAEMIHKRGQDPGTHASQRQRG